MAKIIDFNEAKRRYALIINLFDETNVTTDTGLLDGNKTYFSQRLIDLVSPELIHDQFADK